MEHLFAYGTLMCEDIMHEVSGFRLLPKPAILRSYRRRAVKDQVFPALVPDEGCRVEGLVYQDVPDQAWLRLDRFEGEMYRRADVRVELADGSQLAAETYAICPDFQDRLVASDWDFNEFLRSGKKLFRRRYVGYKELQSTNKTEF